MTDSITYLIKLFIIGFLKVEACQGVFKEVKEISRMIMPNCTCRDARIDWLSPHCEDSRNLTSDKQCMRRRPRKRLCRRFLKI